MKKWLIAVLFCTSSLIFAGECKYCGSDTKDNTIYRCNKCRKFFCENCREGSFKKDAVVPLTRQVQLLDDALKAMNEGVQIVCPECGTRDYFFRDTMREGKIRIIKR